MASRQRILIIKLGALGDFVLSLGAFRAIRDHHPGAEIVLLTTPPLRRLAEASGLFETVWIDERRPLSRLGAFLALRRRLRRAGFARVYDLQRNDRTAAYFWSLWPRQPEWVGKVAGCSHRAPHVGKGRRHIVERESEQLALAGIERVPASDLSFVAAEVAGFALPQRYALLVPGGSAHRPEKRWPAERYAELANRLADRGITPVLLGTAAEARELQAIAAACPAAVNLLGKTSIEQIVVLARGAELAVGNDTGPMHLIATAGCPALALFSSASDPARNAPRGPRVATLQRDPLAALGVEEVLAAISAR